jgi:hypothetical protein
MIPSLWAALRARMARRPPAETCRAKLLVVVEGKHDVEFLRRVSRILHGDDARSPDLSELERQGVVVFVPSAAATFWAGPIGWPV